jgi:two-component system NtrC family sensor kinase
LNDATSAQDALDLVTRRLSERRAGCAVLRLEGDALLVERATLPFAPDVWGQPLALPRLVVAAQRRQPLLERNAEAGFAASANGGAPLFASKLDGAMIAAPLSLGDARGVFCLVSTEIERQDLPSVLAVAAQLSAALRAPGAIGQVSSLPVFDELTRRLSYSLAPDEIVRAGVEVLVPALGAQLAASVRCRGKDDFATVYSSADVSANSATATAESSVDAFRALTGGAHLGCARPPFHAVRLPGQQGTSRVLAALRSTLDAPFVIEGEVRGLLRLASEQPDAFDADAQRTFFTAANQLSIALERALAQQQAERAHLASLAESLADGIILVDASLRVTSMNPAAREFLSELTGEAVAEGVSLETEALAGVARDVLASGRPAEPRELSAGRRHLIATGATLAGSPEGSAAVVVLRDVTEERLMQERLLQSEKMVSVGQLVSGVAHELNNPLTGIMGFAQLLMARELDGETKRDIETIHSEAERAAKIVQNLLSFARRRRAEKELTNVNLLLERVLELRNYDLRVKNIEAALDLDPKLPDTMLDANQIQQVFLNVIINAEQAMLADGGEGTLTVQTRVHQGSIRIVFRDTGPGMTPETLRRIFDPFFTTKDTGEGTGLGLTISYGIIDQHGGKIWAESRPGHGSTFYIDLPIIQGREAVARPEQAEPEAAVAPRSILVVDDEESIQRLLGSILELDGHQVEVARNGVEALERIARRRYDLIITDIKMPDMDGRELHRRLAERDASLAHRTIFITGDTVSPDTRTFLQTVNNPCLTKPFRVRDVRETIAQVLAESS